MSEGHLPHVEVPDPEEVHDRLSRIIAILIVVATLAAAIVGWLHSRADRSVEISAVQAQRLGIEAIGESLTTQQMAQSGFDTLSFSQEQQQRAANSFQQFLFTPAGEDTRFKLEKEIEEQLAIRSTTLTNAVSEAAGLPLITGTAETGPEGDAAFPSQFFAKSGREATRLQSLQDAMNEYRGDWEGQTATYTAILTVFAVALFLFGLSLTLGRGVKRLFATVGLALLAVGGAWTGIVTASPPHLAPDRAASEFADGHEALQTATTPDAYHGAVEHYTRAIELRPSFAQAYLERSQAEFNAGSPQRAGLASVSSPAAVSAAVDDLLMAEKLGLDNVAVLTDLGFSMFVEGIQHDDDALIERGLAFTERAIEEDPSRPPIWFNKGVALLALGRSDEAHEAYAGAVLHTVYIDPAKKLQRADPGTEELFLGGGLTDLESLAKYRPSLGETAAAVKTYLVRTISSEQPEPASAIEAGSPEEPATAEVRPLASELVWLAHLAGFDPDTDSLNVQWYYLDAENLGWAVLPTVSGNDPSPNIDAQDRRWDVSYYLRSSFPPQCLPDGRYRAEVYVNGRLAATGESDASLGGLGAVSAQDLNVAFCSPETWEPLPTSLRGFMNGHASPDGNQGVYLFRYNQPVGFTGQTDAQQTVSFLESTINSFGDRLPATPVYDSATGDQHAFFMGLSSPVQRWYTYPDGYVRAGAGVADDGATIIALVFGPTENFNEVGTLGLRVFESLSVLQAGGASSG